VCDEQKLLDAVNESGGDDLSLVRASADGDAKSFNAAEFFASLVDEHFRGNDRFIVKIWQKLHPGTYIRIWGQFFGDFFTNFPRKYWRFS
jgi:hypothetical protein